MSVLFDLEPPPSSVCVTPKPNAQDPPHTHPFDLGLKTLERGAGELHGPCYADAHKLSAGSDWFSVTGSFVNMIIKNILEELETEPALKMLLFELLD